MRISGWGRAAASLIFFVAGLVLLGLSEGDPAGEAVALSGRPPQVITLGVLGGNIFYAQPIVSAEAVREREIVDTLAYVVGEPNRWPRQDGPSQNQVLAGNSVTFVKGNNPENWETWLWDEKYIYHWEDHSWTVPYFFSDGRWLKRRMRVGEKITVTDNVATYFQRDCSPNYTENPFKYEITLLERDPHFPAGGDIGTADVIVLKYNPSYPADWYQELFYFARGWGWFRWEMYEHGAKTGQGIFNKMGGKPVHPKNRCRPLPAGFPPEDGLPEIERVVPAVAAPGEEIKIIGNDLNPVVQFFDSSGARTTLGARDGVVVNGQRSEVTLRVPHLPAGEYEVKIYLNWDLISEGYPVHILAPAPPEPEPDERGPTEL